jgi:hypothetical protein
MGLQPLSVNLVSSPTAPEVWLACPIGHRPLSEKCLGMRGVALCLAHLGHSGGCDFPHSQPYQRGNRREDAGRHALRLIIATVSHFWFNRLVGF